MAGIDKCLLKKMLSRVGEALLIAVIVSVATAYTNGIRMDERLNALEKEFYEFKVDMKSKVENVCTEVTKLIAVHEHKSTDSRRGKE